MSQPTPPQKLKLGNDFRFTQDTHLYVDMEHFEFIMGGWTEVSFSAGFAAVNRTRSPKHMFDLKLKSHTVSHDRICSRSEAVVSGFLWFFDYDTEEGDESNLIIRTKMDGFSWIGGIVSAERISSFDELHDKSWLFAYFRDDLFTYPKNYIPKLQQPINVYGEIAPFHLHTPFRELFCYLKVRGIAYIAGPSQLFQPTQYG
jgi:hypothetical protein